MPVPPLPPAPALSGASLWLCPPTASQDRWEPGVLWKRQGVGCSVPPQAGVAATRDSESPDAARGGPRSLWCAAVGPALALGCWSLPAFLQTGTTKASPFQGPGSPGTRFGNKAPAESLQGWTLGHPHMWHWGDRSAPMTSSCAAHRGGVTCPSLGAVSRATLPTEPLPCCLSSGQGGRAGPGRSSQWAAASSACPAPPLR